MLLLLLLLLVVIVIIVLSFSNRRHDNIWTINKINKEEPIPVLSMNSFNGTATVCSCRRLIIHEVINYSWGWLPFARERDDQSRSPQPTNSPTAQLSSSSSSSPSSSSSSSSSTSSSIPNQYLNSFPVRTFYSATVAKASSRGTKSCLPFHSRLENNESKGEMLRTQVRGSSYWEITTWKWQRISEFKRKRFSWKSKTPGTRMSFRISVHFYS